MGFVFTVFFSISHFWFQIKTLVDIPSNTWVAEYSGHVLSPPDFERRKKAMPGIANYAICTVVANRTYFVDGAFLPMGRANIMNHSCAPNCGLFTYIYGGNLHIWAEALTFIRAHTQLTIDYDRPHFFRAGDESYFNNSVCLCGSGNCRDRNLYLQFLDFYIKHRRSL